jgi:hypothetical protein
MLTAFSLWRFSSAAFHVRTGSIDAVADRLVDITNWFRRLTRTGS